MARLTPDFIRDALRRPLPGPDAQSRMAPLGRERIPAPPDAQEAGVLLLIYPGPADLLFVLTRRADQLGYHSGQISLPGGRREPNDLDFVATALREAQEEIGIVAGQVQTLGALTALYIPQSNFVVHPVIGYAAGRPAFRPNAAEVAELIEAPLHMLLNPTIRQVGVLSQDGPPVPFYRLGGHAVWGATAMILSEFEMVLRSAGAG